MSNLAMFRVRCVRVSWLGTLVLADGKVRAVGVDVAVPSGAQVIGAEQRMTSRSAEEGLGQ